MNANEARDLVGRPKAKEWPAMKVLFPSLATVETSELGKEVSLSYAFGAIADRQGGGTMFVGQSWKVVTKHLFHDANSKRGGVLMHSKVGWSTLIRV
jgi:tyrosyl-DNA phosphodiesterase-1